MGIAQNALGLTDLARSSFSGALALNPHMAAASASLANLEVRLGNYDETLRLVDTVLKANPGLPSAYVTGAQAYLAKGQIKQAQTMLDQALARDPSSPRVSGVG